MSKVFEGMDPVLAKQRAIALSDWLQEEHIPFDDAAPILAMTIGMILGFQARGTTIERLDEGIEIMRMMIRVSAVFEFERREQ
jgi:hypothetical protein